jgi:dihydrofolate reductase
MKNIIVAYDQDRAIGKLNKLPWEGEMPTDLRHFKRATDNSTVIMGRKTFQSIGSPLSGRRNIVISRTLGNQPGVEIAGDLTSAYKMAGGDGEIFVIGGGDIFKDALESVDRIYATEIDAIFDDATVYFPELDTTKWRRKSHEKHHKDNLNRYDFDFVVYERTS